MHYTVPPRFKDCIGSEVFQQIKTMNHIRVKFYIDTHQVQPSAKNPPRIFCAPHYLHQNMSKKSNQLEWILFHFKELEVLETWLTTTSKLQFKEPEFFVDDRSSRPFIKLLSASNYIKGKCESIKGEWEIEQICKNCSYVKREIPSKKRFNLLYQYQKWNQLVCILLVVLNHE